VDLVAAVVARQRAGLQAQIDALENGVPVPMDQLLAYTDYWKRCILDRSAPFCLVGVLAAELPVLPPEVAAGVQGFFNDLGKWLERVLTLGARQGVMHLEGSPAIEAESFLAAVYGGMLIARAFDDPSKFGVVVEAFVRRIRTDVRR
jgi:TetR/AcrR family transcriptional repressor of nem operon